MKRCVITGASGFLGREVVRRLADEYEVIGVGHTHAGRRAGDGRPIG